MESRVTHGIRSVLRIRGLRQRWLVSAVLPVALLVMAAVAIFTVASAQYYYSSMISGLEARARIAADTFVGYGVRSYNEYYRLASYSVETFEEKDVLELQFINTNGRVQASSYGLTAGTSPGTPDIENAVGGAMGYFQGRDPQTGENILSVSCPLQFNARVMGVLRYVTSLRAVEHQILMSFLAAAGIALLVVILILISNTIFINNVVEPVAVVSDAARRISGGSYGIRVDNRYQDELGELVDNINDMSLKISQAEQIQQEFVSSVSHELRTPLTAMVEELLDFTKIQDGRFTLRVDTVDLVSELEDTIYTYRELFRQEGIELNYALSEEDIPPTVADGERMKQVFSNVFDNARKHGGAGRRIDVSVSREGENLVIRVRDYGPGIPPEDLPFVKQKFYKGSSKARGSGIGLAVCDEIVRLHGGAFEVANAADGGKGAEVTISLPLGSEGETKTE